MLAGSQPHMRRWPCTLTESTSLQIQGPIQCPPSRSSVHREGAPRASPGRAKTTGDSQEGVRSEQGLRGLGERSPGEISGRR